MSELQIVLLSSCIRIILMFCLIDFKNGLKESALIKSMAINLFQTSIFIVLMVVLFAPSLLFIASVFNLEGSPRILSIIYFIGFLVLIYGIDITNNFKYLKGIYPDSLIAKSTLSATLIFILITILALVFLPYP
jgi:hypothetical protein